MTQPATLQATLRSTVAAHGERDAYVGPGGKRSWNQIQAGADRAAAALYVAGVRHGDHVGILLGNEALWIETFFGCAAIGAVAVPVNTRFKADELLFCLKQADVSLLVYADEFLGIAFGAMLQEIEPALATGLPGKALPRLRTAVMVGDGPLPAGAVRHADFIAAGQHVIAPVMAAATARVQPDDVLLIQYTSGTTSFPKGVMLSHANMLRDAAAAAFRIGVQPQDRYFSIRPFFHVAGSTLSVLVSLNTGCCLLSLPKFDVAETLRVLDRERCTLISGNDTIFLMLMGHADFDPAKLHLRGGWAAAGPEVMQQIQDDMRIPHICNAYGQSEASPNVLLSSWDDPFALRAAGWGLPHPGTEVRIADAETSVLLPAGTQGEIQVRGWNVMRGYYNMPEATAKAFTEDGWLKTGDLGEAMADGRVRMVGRLKDMYRVGGENVAPAEVEEVLHAHPAVKQAQVVGVPDPRLGEVTGAFVILKDGQQATRDALVDWCRARCANFKVPKYLEIVDSFDDIGMTGSSKVQKNKLRAHAVELWKLGSTSAGAKT
jgi:fatty-acyl-CoA synthase